MDSFFNPEEVLNQLGLRSDMVVADFGCGSGGFTVPLAKKLDQGLVYAIDIQEAPLSALKSRYLQENINNIRIIRSDLEVPRGSRMGDSSLDFVFIVNILFQAENKEIIFEEAKRVLKSGGRLVAIDWLASVKLGPEKGRILPEEAKKIAKKFGLKIEKEFPAGKQHYGILFAKP